MEVQTYKVPLKERLKQKWADFKKKFAVNYENIKKKINTILIVLLIGVSIWVLFEFVYIFFGFSIYEWFLGIPVIGPAFGHFAAHIASGSYLGIFYTFLFSSLFFLPIPLEALYFFYLNEGIFIPFLLVITVSGIVLGQIFNYGFGRIFTFLLKFIAKEKTQEKVKTYLDKYGGVTILTVHIIPVPYQIINFVTGGFKYPFKKWIKFVLIGMIIKHIAMAVIFLLMV
ncbi:YqaA family protein [Nanoarchaeota archaeon]